MEKTPDIIHSHFKSVVLHTDLKFPGNILKKWPAIYCLVIIMVNVLQQINTKLQYQEICPPVRGKVTKYPWIKKTRVLVFRFYTL